MAERDYLISEGLTRLIFAGYGVLMISAVAGILILMSARPQGRYDEPDRSQFLTTVADAATAIGEYRMNDDGSVNIPIERAITLVAERGVDAAFTSAQDSGGRAETTQEEAEQSEASQDAAAVETDMSAQEADSSAESGQEETSAQDDETQAEAETPSDEDAAPTDETSETAQAVAGSSALASAFSQAAEGGESAYIANCSGCHQANGQGIPSVFPALVGHTPDLFAAERSYLPTLLLYGLQGEIQVDGQSYNGVMPAWDQLSDEELAAILNYTLSSWGNADALAEDAEPYTLEDIASERDQGLSSGDVYELRQGLELP